MQPIVALMEEHGLIMTMIALMKERLEMFEMENKADINFIAIALDFIRTYADKCHHGKEEAILFQSLDNKPLSSVDKNTLQELRDDHGHARKTIIRLAEARDRYAAGDQENFAEILNSIKELTELYPKHIEKEDQYFFMPAMQYYRVEEQQEMLKEFWEYDRTLIHMKYKNVVEELQTKTYNHRAHFACAAPSFP